MSRDAASLGLPSDESIVLDALESRSVYVIREARARFKRPSLLWSCGKDSTAMLWLCRKAFLGEVPFPVIHIDTGRKFSAIYEFRDHLASEWDLDLRVYRSDRALANTPSAAPAGSRIDCCKALKTAPLRQAVSDMELDALLVGIRRDEHAVRAKEYAFSARDASFRWEIRDTPGELWGHYQSAIGEGTHTRVHPLLHMTELDIWRLILRDEIPALDLYFADGDRRYRSVGCECCCQPIRSNATTVPEVIDELVGATTGERDGRAQDKESAFAMEKLRSLGYL